MNVRGTFWLIVLCAIVAGIAFLGHFGGGQVLVMWPPYRIDLSLTFCALALIVLFIVVHALLRMIAGIWSVPGRVAVHRERARHEKAHAALRDALSHLYAGRYARAEKAAAHAGAIEKNAPAASLVAAAAAHHLQEYGRRDEWLDKVSHPDWQEARQIATAGMRADTDDAQGALDALSGVEGSGKRIHAQQVALRAHQQLGNWREVLKVSRGLEKRSALPAEAGAQTRLEAAEHLLREHGEQADALLDVWQSLSPAERSTPRLADLAAAQLIGMERRVEARRIVEHALGVHWSGLLLRRYPETADADALPLIQNAELWQLQHPDDPELQFALGRLCLRQQLWGKAQAFFETTLGLAGDKRELQARVHCELGKLFEQIGESEQAAQHFRASALAA
jgi:HemY protein